MNAIYCIIQLVHFLHLSQGEKKIERPRIIPLGKLVFPIVVLTPNICNYVGFDVKHQCPTGIWYVLVTDLISGLLGKSHCALQGGGREGEGYW